MIQAEIAKIRTTLTSHEPLNSATATQLGVLEALLFESSGRPFRRALSEIAEATTALAKLFESGQTGARGGIHQVHDLRSMVRALEVYLDNFIDEDLSDLNLANMELAGIFWSNKTRWPASQVERIRRASIAIYEGVYQVQKSAS